MPAGLLNKVDGSSGEAPLAKDVATLLALWSLKAKAPACSRVTPPASSNAPTTAEAPQARREG